MEKASNLNRAASVQLTAVTSAKPGFAATEALSTSQLCLVKGGCGDSGQSFGDKRKRRT